MTAELKREVARLFDDYVDAYNRDDMEACQRYYAVPCQMVSARGVSIYPTREAFLESWRKSLAELRGAGLAKSVVTDVEALILAPDMAVAGVRYDRLGADGGLREQICGTYSLHKGADGWKVVAFLIHPRETWLGHFTGIGAGG